MLKTGRVNGNIMDEHVDETNRRHHRDSRPRDSAPSDGEDGSTGKRRRRRAKSKSDDKTGEEWKTQNAGNEKRRASRMPILRRVRDPRADQGDEHGEDEGRKDKLSTEHDLTQRPWLKCS